MICPRCKTEYREGYNLCADCSVELVEELTPPAPAAARARFVPLTTVRSLNEYGAIGAHLDAAGIIFFPGPEIAERLDFPLTMGVHEDQTMEARSLLEDLAEHDLADGPEIGFASGEVNLPDEARAGVALRVEAAVARDGRFLVFVDEKDPEGLLSLPGGPVTPDITENTLEEALRRILSEVYGLEVGEDLVYLGDRLERTGEGLAARVLFLARWRLGGFGEEGARWLGAAEIEGLPGAPPMLREGIRRANGARMNKGW